MNYAKGEIDITLRSGGALHLRLGSREAVLNGEPLRLEAAPYLEKQQFKYNGWAYEEELTYVPLRLVAEAFGARVDYRPDKARVYVESGEPLAVPGPAGEVPLRCMTTYNCQGMHSSLNGYWGYQRVAGFWRLLQEGRLRQVSEPLTEHGDMVNFWDYYCIIYRVGFYAGGPSYRVHPPENPEAASFKFILYRMYEGEREFGPDSRCLLYDQMADEWWVLDEAAYDEFCKQLNNSGEVLAYESA